MTTKWWQAHCHHLWFRLIFLALGLVTGWYLAVFVHYLFGPIGLALGGTYLLWSNAQRKEAPRTPTASGRAPGR